MQKYRSCGGKPAMTPKTFRLIAILTLVMIIIVTLISIYTISIRTETLLKRTAEEKVLTIAGIAASQIDGDMFEKISTGEEKTQNLRYIQNPLWQIKQANPSLLRVYAMRIEANTIEFVVDGDYRYIPYTTPIGFPDSRTGTGLVPEFINPSMDNEFISNDEGGIQSGYAPIKDSRGNVVGIVGIDMDNTDILAQIRYLHMLPFLIGVMTAAAMIGIIIIERRRGINERTIRESERIMNILLNAVPDDLALINQEKKIIAVNDSMAEKLGTDRKAVAGKNIGDFISSAVLDDTLNQINRTPANSGQIYFDEKWNDRWLETSVFPVQDESGKDVSIAIQSHDVTRHKTIEEELKKDVLLQIEENIEKFQILNDQIRNPLQVIRGYLSLSPPKYHDDINTQIEIINNIVTQLDMGWLESQKVQQFLLKHYPAPTRSYTAQQKEGDT